MTTETAITAREAWLGQRDGVRDPSARETVFRDRDSGECGTLTECHITGHDSAHPGAWTFRLSDGTGFWHWEMALEVA